MTFLPFIYIYIYTTYAKNTSPHKNTAHFSTTFIPQKSQKAEQLVTDYLQSNGHQITARNHKTYFYEIDIISTKDDHIYFTEVKYRQSSAYGSGLDAITPAKLHQMHFAALSYLKYQNTKFKNHQPLLAVASVSGNLDQNPQITWFPLV